MTAEVEHEGDAGLWRAREGSYDVIVLDIMLPRMNGYRICRTLRDEENWTPILMLTAKDGEWDEAEALDTGADDFLSKPFSFVVLLARLRALARRTTSARPVILQAGSLTFDVAASSVRRGPEEIRLSRRELDVLEVLMRGGGDVSRWLPRSVRFRTTLAATLVTAVVLGVASLVIVALVERDLKHNTRAALSDVLETASHSADGEESQGGEGGEQSESGEAAGLSGAPEAASAEPDGESINDVRQRLIANTSIAEVRVGVDAASQALLIIVPAVVAVLALAIWLTVGRALRPVQAISTRVAAISGSTLDERVPEPDSGDEIAALAALMNEMLARLQAASDRQRAFVANASHELRSPLSTIVVAAEVAEISPDPQKLQKLSERIGGEARRLQTLIEVCESKRARQPRRVRCDRSGGCRG